MITCNIKQHMTSHYKVWHMKKITTETTVTGQQHWPSLFKVSVTAWLSLIQSLCHHLKASNLILIHNHVSWSESGPWRCRLQCWEICQRGEGYGSVLWSVDSEWQDPSPVSLCETGPLYLSPALTLWPLTPFCQVILMPPWPAMKPESTLGDRKHASIKQLKPAYYWTPFSPS